MPISTREVIMSKYAARWIAPSSGGYSAIVVKDAAGRSGDKASTKPDSVTAERISRIGPLPKTRGGASPVGKPR